MEQLRYYPPDLLFPPNVAPLFSVALLMITEQSPEPIHPSQRTEKAIAAVMLLVLLLSACSIGYAPAPGNNPTPTPNGCPEFAGYHAQPTGEICTLDQNRPLTDEAPSGWETRYIPDNHRDYYVPAEEGEKITGVSFEFKDPNK